MSLIDNYISYVSGVRRYSPRTVAVYSECLSRFASFAMEGTGGEDDSVILSSLTPGFLRSYEVHLLEGDPEHEKLSPRTVCLHMSVISGFCRYLIRTGMLKGNPAAVSGRPKAGFHPFFFNSSSVIPISWRRSTRFHPPGIWTIPPRPGWMHTRPGSGG